VKKPKTSPHGYSSSVGKEFVRKHYNAFARKYFPADVLPDFDSLDFEFAEHPGELGSVTYVDGIPYLSMRPFLRKYPSLVKSVLLHEMVHLKLGPSKGHGEEFYDEETRIWLLGGKRIWG
jgi:hypothetical protein